MSFSTTLSDLEAHSPIVNLSSVCFLFNSVQCDTLFTHGSQSWKRWVVNPRWNCPLEMKDECMYAYAAVDNISADSVA